jgi:competence protein ComEA
MRSRRSTQEQVAEVARRRLELLSAELAEIRPSAGQPLVPDGGEGSGGSDPVPMPAQVPAPVPAPAPASTPPPGPGRHAHPRVDRPTAVAGWLEDRLPGVLQGRLRVTAAHVAAVVLLLCAGAGATAWWVARAQGSASAVTPTPSTASPLVDVGAGPLATASATPAPDATPGSPTSAAAGPGAAPAASPAGASQVVVDVTGKVRHPGIATLPAGSRVVDALQAAGGARHGVSLTSLNLARVLTDGEQIVVGVRPPRGTAATAASAPVPSPGAVGSVVPMVDVNTAGQAELEALPGVGPVTAQSILQFRSEHGPFTAVEELLEVSGIGDATLAKIAPYVTL